jgi:hypothetical protein
MCKKLTNLIAVLLFLAVTSGVQAQTTTYTFDGSFFSYGTIDLGTGAFTSMNFLPQGSSYYPATADNNDINGQYAIMSDFNYPANYYLWYVNFSTLTGDSLATVGPLASGQTSIKGMAYNRITDTWYVISGDDFGSASDLYTLNITTGELTVVGQVQNANLPVAMAIDCDGNAYLINIEMGASSTAVLNSLNLTTAVATAIGTDLGLAMVTGFSQDMDFNPENGNLYWSGYWSDGFFSEGGSFRLVDITNGTSTEIGTFGQFETITGFSIDGDCPPVPVELSSFTANANGTSAVLNWSTATETNNQGFSIERKSAKTNWQEVGYVPGFGTSTEQHSYSFSDDQLNAGSYSYRLKQTDFNGSFEYSDVVNVEISIPSEFSLDQNYPNPFNPTTNISYSIPLQSFVSIRVYSVTGEEVAVLANGVQTEGHHQATFDARNLASGIYIVRMSAGSFSSTIKMNLLK